MISIIIPTYNRLPELQRCIQSVVAEYFEGLEVIVIDDCSTDKTKEYLIQLSQDYNYIIPVFNNPNAGVNYARNRGIEVASKKYILFLDSDDELERGALSQVIHAIQSYPQHTHFLFAVSDRSDEIKNVSQVKKIDYADWVGGKITGDFTHVLRSDIMKKFPFFEQFRMFENLNWFRVFKDTSPQLLIPIVTARRERDRQDSLTSGLKLRSKNAIFTKFEAQLFFYNEYYRDLVQLNPASLGPPLINTIMLGVACNCKKEAGLLLKYVQNKPLKIAGSLILLMPSSWMLSFIIAYSKYNKG